MSGEIVALIQGDRVLLALVVCCVMFVFGVFVAAAASPAPTEPPTLATFLLVHFLRTDRLEFVLGDLDLRFREVALKFGASNARAWYWAQVARSLPYALLLAPLHAAAAITAAVASILLHLR